MQRIVTLLVISAAAVAPAMAQEPSSRPFAERDLTAVDVAATPMSDLNLRKSEIPALLIAAQEKPYDMTGLNRCSQIAAAVGELDAMLGEDLDMPRTARNGPSAGRLAQWAVGSFMPFRGAIRELSGANLQERRIQAAVQAGLARRAFLKGAGQAKGCRYPASAATPEHIAAYTAEQEALSPKAIRAQRKAARGARQAQGDVAIAR